MTEYAELSFKRNRGWPWPEDSWGLTPMFGEDGWCHSCGTPQRRQCGSLILQRKGFDSLDGAWVPNWQFDAICLEQPLADEVAGRYSVDICPVAWHGPPPSAASQIIAPSVGDAWFDSGELRAAATDQHGTAGVTCSACGVWRWMPLAFGSLPSLRPTPALGDVDV